MSSVPSVVTLFDGSNAMARVRRALGLAMVVVLALAIFAGGWLVGRLGIGRWSIRRR